MWCSDDWPGKVVTEAGGSVTFKVSQGRVVYFTVVSGALFFAPVVVMAATHAAIISKLRDAKLPGEATAASRLTHRRLKRKVGYCLLWAYYYYSASSGLSIN